MISFENLNYRKNPFKNSNFKNKIFRNNKFKKIGALSIILILGSICFISNPSVSNASISQSVLSIDKGGTNANTLESAQENLGKTNVIDLNTSDNQFPSSKAVYDYINFMTNEKIITLTNTGEIIGQKDDGDWTIMSKITSDTSYAWVSFAFGKGLYLAVANKSNKAWISSSKNGISWSEPEEMPGFADSTYGYNMAIDSAFFANEKFIFAGARGYISTSTNGIDFAEPTTPAPIGTYWFNLQYVNNVVFAIGGNLRYISKSVDGGINWTTPAQTCSQSGSNRWMTYGNGKYLVWGDGGDGRLTLSADAATWECPSFTPDGGIQASVTFFKDKFYSIGSTNGTIMKSSDGTAWTETLSLPNYQLGTNSLMYLLNNKLIIFQNADNNIKKIWTSDDAENFTYNTITVPGNIVRAIFT
jgi:hypothetical protein